mmetsp:Transcript_23181/g.53587  ORF Transcript_23181/g.53587 Transcript_23181/m.53587 type:complete len:86 (+) Transcript_23181:58-315(+)|eukprot:CAMPEP_0182555552 /NCGR_PEP_ID=MMETSP1324-20130603/66_1 /TAXON_ID=236786 /ORGANISM="Florenciella sp., Strain RCC1587" /LENGTH=85 /DNA_ID=CAMNT_0024767293 /DNA_START=27 /DNA_END=284 /DNA_ORIENTATION=+
MFRLALFLSFVLSATAFVPVPGSFHRSLKLNMASPENPAEVPIDRRENVVKAGEGTVLEENPVIDEECEVDGSSTDPACRDNDPL